MIRRREFIAGFGSAAAWPAVARAQQPAVPVIGVLTWAEATFNTAMIVEFRQGLAKVGYIEGQNVAIEYRWADTQIARLPALAADLVHRQVAVIIAGGILNPILAAKRATSTIPIVFAYGGDPVKDGLVTSLNRPGGNVTGMAAISSELVGKKLSLVGDLVPPAATVAFLAGLPGDSHFEDQKTQIRAAARALGRKVMILETRSDRNYEAAFKTLVQGRAGALIVGSYAFRNNEIVALAARYKIPTIYNDRGWVRSGGLMSYAPDTSEILRQAGVYAGRILKGEKPADLPVMLPTKFELAINLKTAKALGLTIPETLLATADEVIQ